MKPLMDADKPLIVMIMIFDPVIWHFHPTIEVGMGVATMETP